MFLTEYQQSLLDRALNDTAVGGPLVGMLADLTKVNVPISANNVLADFTAAVANFVGYAQGTVTWDLPTVSADGNVEVVGSLAVWRPTNAVTPNVIYNIYFTDSGGTKLYFAGLFDGAPLPMGSALDQIEVVVRYRPATQSLCVVIA